MFNLSLIMLLK